jgi:hypothetical protein
MPGLQRLGETTEFRSLLLDMLVLDGWEVGNVPAFGGGVLVIARHDQHAVEVRRQGASVADVACDVFQEAMALRGYR